MAGTPFTTGPAFLTNAATNVASVNPSANTYKLMKHIHMVNTDASAIVVTLYKGATGGSAAGTEIFNESIAAKGHADVYYPAGDRYATTDFLSGLGATTNKVTIETMGETWAL